MHDKFKIWLSVGGHVELDEDPMEAAVREVKEEVGLSINIPGDISPSPESGFIPLLAPRFLCRHRVSDTHEHVCFVYFATADTEQIADSVLDHEKDAETKWVTKEELDKMDLVPNVRFYAKEALKALAS